MHRMMFEDFKILMPDAEIHFACPFKYHDAVVDHPYVDLVLDSDTVRYQDYLIHYNTTTACGRYEMQIAPLSDKHRSDIWAKHCGIELTKHEMHFQITEKEKAEGKELLEKQRDREGPIVLVAPISAMKNKDLTDQQLLDIVAELRTRKCCPVGIHGHAIFPLLQNDVPQIHGTKLRQWLSVIDQADYVVSVDTSHFHAAGGLKKPLVGIFTFVNSKTYSKYYSTAELVQGPCPFNTPGCYDWGVCGERSEVKPCRAQMRVEYILEAVDRMFQKFPWKSGE